MCGGLRPDMAQARILGYKWPPEPESIITGDLQTEPSPRTPWGEVEVPDEKVWEVIGDPYSPNQTWIRRPDAQANIDVSE